MVKNGDAGTPIWATEFGWLMDPGFGLGQYDWMKVSPDQQAHYVVRSYQYARKNWPWMKGMLLSNLDASTSPYHQGPEDGLPWFAILNADYSPRPAWKAFRTWAAQNGVPHHDRGDREAGATRRAATDRPRPTRAPDSAGPFVRVAEHPGLGRQRSRATEHGRSAPDRGARGHPAARSIGADVTADGHTWRNVKTLERHRRLGRGGLRQGRVTTRPLPRSPRSTMDCTPSLAPRCLL